MSRSSIPGLSAFVRDYPLMSVRPSSGETLLLQGRFAFTARSENHGPITDRYALSIDVPRQFPKTLPRITETEQKIPRNGDFHVNPDGTLCLGSPLRLLVKLASDPTLTGFTDRCLIPYLLPYRTNCKMEVRSCLTNCLTVFQGCLRIMLICSV